MKLNKMMLLMVLVWCSLLGMLTANAQAQVGAWGAGVNETPAPGFINLTTTQNAATVAASYGYTLLDPLSGACGPDYFPYVAFGTVRKYYTVQTIPRPIGIQRVLKLWKQVCYTLQ